MFGQFSKDWLKMVNTSFFLAIFNCQMKGIHFWKATHFFVLTSEYFVQLTSQTNIDQTLNLWDAENFHLSLPLLAEVTSHFTWSSLCFKQFGNLLPHLNEQLAPRPFCGVLCTLRLLVNHTRRHGFSKQNYLDFWWHLQ